MPADFLREAWEHYGGHLRETNREQSTRCVIHDDRFPSASVNTDLGVFFCHACGAKGDAYKLIEIKEGLRGFAAIVARAEEISGRSLTGVSRTTEGGPSRVGLRGKAWTPKYRGPSPAGRGSVSKAGA